MQSIPSWETERRIDFGLFDWIDFGNPDDLGRQFEQRLSLLEYADTQDFYCYHLAEHHLTALSGAPSPGIFLAAVAQRTKRIRLGALVHILPLYHPVRLAQEICMLDHLSNGRLVIGTGRGVSPYELEALGVAPDSSADLYEESFHVLIDLLRNGRMEAHRGQNLSYPSLELSVRPVQRPYPPLWYPWANLETAIRVGAEAINTASLSVDLDAVRAARDAFFDAWRANRDNPIRLNAHEPAPRFGIMRHVYVGDNSARACDQAKTAYGQHRDRFTYLWRAKGDNRVRPADDFELSLREGRIVVGEADEVGAALSAQLKQTGANYLLANFTFGDLDGTQVKRSVELFAQEVIPTIRRGAMEPRTQASTP